ncbi:hypothetical protein B0H12DRAFT_1224015 [Mycena haematopus]|nr:hypothetical protein B0H12DRAFT_1224015 [Mycena haematopus]
MTRSEAASTKEKEGKVQNVERNGPLQWPFTKVVALEMVSRPQTAGLELGPFTKAPLDVTAVRGGSSSYHVPRSPQVAAESSPSREVAGTERTGSRGLEEQEHGSLGCKKTYTEIRGQNVARSWAVQAAAPRYAARMTKSRSMGLKSYPALEPMTTAEVRVVDHAEEGTSWISKIFWRVLGSDRCVKRSPWREQLVRCTAFSSHNATAAVDVIELQMTQGGYREYGRASKNCFHAKEDFSRANFFESILWPVSRVRVKREQWAGDAYGQIPISFVPAPTNTWREIARYIGYRPRTNASGHGGFRKGGAKISSGTGLWRLGGLSIGFSSLMRLQSVEGAARTMYRALLAHATAAVVRGGSSTYYVPRSPPGAERTGAPRSPWREQLVRCTALSSHNATAAVVRGGSSTYYVPRSPPGAERNGRASKTSGVHNANEYTRTAFTPRRTSAPRISSSPFCACLASQGKKGAMGWRCLRTETISFVPAPNANNSRLVFGPSTEARVGGKDGVERHVSESRACLSGKDRRGWCAGNAYGWRQVLSVPAGKREQVGPIRCSGYAHPAAGGRETRSIPSTPTTGAKRDSRPAPSTCAGSQHPTPALSRPPLGQVIVPVLKPWRAAAAVRAATERDMGYGMYIGFATARANIFFIRRCSPSFAMSSTSVPPP